MTDPSKMTKDMIHNLWSHWSARAKAQKPILIFSDARQQDFGQRAEQPWSPADVDGQKGQKGLPDAPFGWSGDQDNGSDIVENVVGDEDDNNDENADKDVEDADEDVEDADKDVEDADKDGEDADKDVENAEEDVRTSKSKRPAALPSPDTRELEGHRRKKPAKGKATARTHSQVPSTSKQSGVGKDGGGPVREPRSQRQRKPSQKLRE
jgi:hypothetical protein